MGSIRLEGVRKTFGRTTVIPGVDLDIKDGTFVVFVGPSGCGKSTLLRLIAGLEDVSAGRIIIDGNDVAKLPPAKRGLAMVFQSYALYPHMTVRKNIGFGLRMAGRPRDEVARKVEAASNVLNLSAYLDRKPGELSGGQRQRVAIGRAIVREPKAFLFDEPLSNLDAALRVQMRLEIARLQRNLATTTVYVTHDQVEAMTLAERIVVLNGGRVEQVGSPLELYARPDNLFVAGFIGSPRMNFVSGELAARMDAATIGVRPEHIVASRDGEGWRGTVVAAEHLGSDTFLYIDVPQTDGITARAIGELGLKQREIAAVLAILGAVIADMLKAKIHRLDSMAPRLCQPMDIGRDFFMNDALKADLRIVAKEPVFAREGESGFGPQPWTPGDKIGRIEQAFYMCPFDRCQALVGIDVEDPFAAGCPQADIARRGEIARPAKLDEEAGPILSQRIPAVADGERTNEALAIVAHMEKARAFWGANPFMAIPCIIGGTDLLQIEGHHPRRMSAIDQSVDAALIEAADQPLDGKDETGLAGHMIQ